MAEVPSIVEVSDCRCFFLGAAKKVLTVSVHYGCLHVKDFRERLESLHQSDRTLFGGEGASRTDVRFEVLRLAAAKESQDTWHQKPHCLFRGYFHSTETK